MGELVDNTFINQYAPLWQYVSPGLDGFTLLKSKNNLSPDIAVFLCKLI